MPPADTPPGRAPPTYDPAASDDASAAPALSVAWEPAEAPVVAASIPPEQPGRYRSPASGAVIGRGGIGVVLAVWDEVLGREVACKVLAAGGARGPAAERFIREARATARLQHPGIVPIYDIGRRPDGAPFFTMKYVRGHTLAAAIQARPTLAARLELLGAFVDLCQAVAYAHSHGVIHRDLKPANVMVGEFGETVVLDWGLARVVDADGPSFSSQPSSRRPTRDGEEPPQPSRPRREGEAATRGLAAEGHERSSPETDPRLTMAGSVLGTPAYMSPEQAAGDLDALDARSDVWSLGAVLYEILSGHPPFAGLSVPDVLRALRASGPPPLARVCVGAPPALVAIVERAMALDPARRYARAEEVAADVEAWRAGGRVGAYAYAPWELARLFLARHRLPVAIATVGVLALLIVGLGAAVRVVAERDRARAAEEVALSREREALANLADALAEKAVSTPEIDPFSAEVFAAGALTRGERPEARGQIARVARRWAPTLEHHLPIDGGCGALAWAGATLLCAREARLNAWEGEAPRYVVDLAARLAIHEIGVSPDGARVALPLADGAVVVLDARAGRVVQRLEHGPDVALRNVVFSADGARLFVAASRAHEGLVAAWDLGSGRQVGTFEGVYPTWLARAPDGAIWASTRGYRGRLAGVLELDPRDLEPGRYWEGADSPGGIGWSPGGAVLAGALGDGTIQLWRAEAPDPARIIGELGRIGLVRWSDDGSLLAELREDGVATIWRAEPWTPLFRMNLPSRSFRAFAWRGPRFAVATADGIALWRVEPPPSAANLLAGAARVGGPAFPASGDWLFTAGADGLHRWSLDGEPLARWPAPGGAHGAGLSPDGALAVSVTDDGAVAVDLGSGAVRARYVASRGRVASFADQGRRALVLGWDGVLRGFDVAGGAPRWESAAEGGFDEVLSGEAPLALLLARSGAVLRIDTRDGRIAWMEDGEALYYAGLSRDGRWAALLWRDGTVTLREMTNGAEIARFRTYEGMNIRASVSDDGALVAVGGSDSVVRLWDRATGAVIAVLRGHRRRIQDLAFAPSGRLLVSMTWGGDPRLWDLTDLRTPGVVLLERAQRRSLLRLDGVRVVGAGGEGR